MAQSDDSQEKCEKYMQANINLLVLLLKTLGASPKNISEALKPLNG